MEKRHPLLLSTSEIFDGANLIDCIRQSYIDLNDSDDIEIVDELLHESIEYLFKDISYDVANELISLILKCFMCLSADSLPHLNFFYAKAKTNQYSIISFISVLSYLINNKTDLDYSNFNAFINDSLNEIRPQIQNQNKLILFNHEIPYQFKDDLILDLLLSANPTEQLVDDFFDFCKNNDNDIRRNNKFKVFFNKIYKEGFVSESFPTSDILFYKSKPKNDNKNLIEPKKRANYEIEGFEFINSLFKNSFIEFNDQSREKIVKEMLKDKTNMLYYFQIIFENLPIEGISPLDLLSYFNEEYELSKEDFIKILDNVFVYHYKENVFVPKPQYKPLNLDDSKFNEKLINQLFDIASKDPTYSVVFTILKYIAYSYPFIFQSNPKRLFDAILPAMENINLLFDFKSPNEKENTKKTLFCMTSISAVFTLIYALNSTKVYDVFIPWFFDNVDNMSLSQIFCMLYIFLSLSVITTLPIQTSKFLKYGIFEKISDILLRKVPDNLFGDNFNYLMYKFLQIQHIATKDLNERDIISIEFNKKRDNAFFEFSGRRITHSYAFIEPMGYSIFYLVKDRIEKINKHNFALIDFSKKLKTTYLIKSRTKNQNISEHQVNDFIQLYKKLTIKQNEAENQSFPDFSDDIKIGKILKIMKLEPWIYRYIFKDQKFPLLEEHCKLLSKAYEILSNEEEEKEKNEFNQIKLKDLNAKEYFLSYKEDDNFIHNLFDRITRNYFKPIKPFKNYLKMIQTSEINLINIFQTICDNIKFIEKNEVYYNPSTCESFRCNLEILAFFILNTIENKNVQKEIITKNFFEKIENDLIKIILKPQFRENLVILKEHYKLLCLFSNYPNRVLQIIEFMLLSGDKYLIKSSSALCLGIKDDSILQISSILESYFINELNSENPCKAFISNVIKLPKSCGNAHNYELMDLLGKSLQKYKEEGEVEVENNNDDDVDENKDIKLKDFIIHLLDFLSPDRDDSKSFGLSDSIFMKKNSNDVKFRFNPIPDYIYNSSPRFWSLFEEYRPIINEILLKEYKQNKLHDIPTALCLILDISVKQFSSRLVRNFPECFSFDFRSTFFQQLIHDDLNINPNVLIQIFVESQLLSPELLHRFIDSGAGFTDDLKLKIDPNNIYEDSFKQLSSLEPEKWKKIIKISYKDNEGIDAGGLIKDWFTKLSIEIFDPSKELFDCTKKNNEILPSRSLTARSNEGLQRIKFAGMIVARALMQEILIPVHFTKHFLKQILHHESKITEKDLEDEDEAMYKSLEFYKSFDFNQHPEIDVRFDASVVNGETVELKPNGSQIKVNNENKDEYIKLYTHFILIDSIKQQVNAFCEGFDSLVPHKKIQMFTPTELCLLISGVPKIDVMDLMQNVEYEEPYNAENPVVKLFFETIKKWDDENLAKLLVFITGASKMPANGFKELKKPIKIADGGDASRLPCSHTCINTLDLPHYKTEDEMNSKLLTAINVNDFFLK